ncbi:MAG: Transglutaminase protein, partial [Candidatus Poribacteria bacterium]|nr:Transglutaminase protein [Candidatus Poribacteria bacterium]
MFMKNFLPAIFGFIFLFILMTLYEQNAFSSEFKSVWMKNLPYESWMNATMLGVKVGYMHTRVDRDKYNGQDVLRVDSGIFNEIKRFGMSIKLT